MPSNKKILILPGDGIGMEVMNEVINIINWMAKNKSISFDISERLVGGAAYDQEGDSISDVTMDEALQADAVLFGAVGGSKWDDVKRSKRPEAALLRLRKELDLFANLRPAVVFDALANSSSLKLEVVKGLDILILRELTSGVYFGQPRGIEKINDGEEKAVDTQSYTTSEVIRVGKVAFDLAKKRSNKVTSVEKSNVMETGMFWRMAGAYDDPPIVSSQRQNVTCCNPFKLLRRSADKPAIGSLKINICLDQSITTASRAKECRLARITLRRHALGQCNQLFLFLRSDQHRRITKLTNPPGHPRRGQGVHGSEPNGPRRVSEWWS